MQFIGTSVGLAKFRTYQAKCIREMPSRSACLALAPIDAEGLSGRKNAFTSYLWLLRAEIKDSQQLARGRNAMTKDELKTVDLTQAEWVLVHKEYWRRKRSSTLSGRQCSRLSHLLRP